MVKYNISIKIFYVNGGKQMHGTMIFESISDSLKEICHEKNIRTLKKVHLTVNPATNLTKDTLKEELRINMPEIATDNIQIILDNLKTMDKQAIINSIEGY